MSILIKGIEKPKNCGICPFELDGFPDDWEMHCKLLGRQVGYFDKKSKMPKDYPIVEVPTPHGRLIDEKQIPYIDLNADMPQSKVRVWTTFKDKIDRLPTIIEAEEANHVQ